MSRTIRFQPQNVHSRVASDAVQHWYKTPVFDARLEALRLVVAWQDQGWGNRKGHLYARRADSNNEWTKITTSTSPHNSEMLAVDLPIDSFDISAPAAFELGFVVGGGGGHELRLSMASLEVTFQPSHSVQSNSAEETQLANLVLPEVHETVGSDSVQLWSTAPTQHDLPTTARLVVRWRDQGWGNRKGHLFARRHGCDWTRVTTTTAPHAAEVVALNLPSSVLGASFDLGFVVGGGGGHELHISDARLEIALGPVSFTADAAIRNGSIASSSADMRRPNQVALGRFPDDTQLLGTYTGEVMWNGTFHFTIHQNRVEFKGMNIFVNDLDFVEDREGTRLRFTCFVPGARSSWVHGLVGLTETFDIRFTSRDCSAFKGTFQRQGEGAIGIDGRRVESEAQRVARLQPIKVECTALTNADASCPICFEGWSSERICVQTSCGHRFCMGCVTSCCAMTPPRESGLCPLCRATVTLQELRRVEVV